MKDVITVEQYRSNVWGGNGVLKSAQEASSPMMGAGERE
jgi:hypothetical protein